ncbi:TY-Chap domain-containing protein [Actinomadura formosensis]|uniref:SseB family protein n=1 Tax=Actinomadura formosensis TaxID=60706 RepID=UPI003D9238D2
MLEWSEFARRLGRELAGLERDTILIVRERDESRHYVQAMREPDRLYAEAVSNNFLDGPLLLTAADEEVMSDAGWRPPADPAPRNWWTELPAAGLPGGMLNVTDGDYARLAGVMVTALRDVQGVRRPSDLVYESFHRHGTGLIELLDFGIDVADPSRVTMRRATSGGAPAGADADTLESRLAEAKANGDNTTYFRLLAGADLVLPATASAVEDPDRAEYPTIAIGGDTYVTVFTSPGALARTGDRHPGLYRRTSFARLATGWPDPAWRLAINWGLPSEVLLDSSVLGRLDDVPDVPPPTGPDISNPSAGPDVSNPYGTVDPHALSGPNPVAGGSADVNVPYDASHTAIDPYTAADLQAAIETGTAGPETREPAPAAGPPLSAPTSRPANQTNQAPDQGPDQGPPRAPAPERQAPGVPIRPPHGTRLWRSAEDGDETPLAVYDAIGGVWAQVRADAVPAPWTE